MDNRVQFAPSLRPIAPHLLTRRALRFLTAWNLTRKREPPCLSSIGKTSRRAASSSTARAALPREEMIAFAAEFDPQPMHLDEAAARTTMLGGLARVRLVSSAAS